jgi:type II secretory pathway pseudopilin PulG
MRGSNLAHRMRAARNAINPAFAIYSPSVAQPGEAKEHLKTNTGTPKFAAFLSYSHADEALANWIHSRLEAYRIPKGLEGRTTGRGVVGKWVGKVFQDRKEMAAGGYLDEKIEAALAASDCLIVLCSPASAASRHVEEEIRFFKQLRRGARILAAILGGEPHAKAQPELECFSPALRYSLSPDGKLSTTPDPGDPLAADFREGKDGRETGLLKLIAGILDLDLDDLIQRQRKAEKRRRRVAYGIAGGMVALAVAAVLAAILAWSLKGAADRARSQTEAEKVRTEAQRQLALGRYLASSALGGTRPELDDLSEPVDSGTGKPAVNRALAVEALRRLPLREANAFAAELAIRENQWLADARGIEPYVLFPGGSREVAVLSHAEPGLVLIDPDTLRKRTVPWANTGLSAYSRLAAESSTSRYLTIESKPASLIDLATLGVQKIEADSARTWISTDSSRISSFLRYRLVPPDVLSIYSLPGFTRVQVPLRESESVFPDRTRSQFLGSIDEGLLVIDASGRSRQFVFPRGYTALAEGDGDIAFITLAKTDRSHVSPVPPVAIVDFGEKIPTPVPATTSSEPGREPGPVRARVKVRLPPGPIEGCYRLRLPDATAERIPSPAGPVNLMLSPDGKTLAEFGLSEFSMLDLATNSRILTAPLQLSETDSGWNDGWFAASDDAGWIVMDLANRSYWRIDQAKPKKVYLSAHSGTAVLIGGEDFIIEDLAARSILARARLRSGGGPSEENLSVSADGKLVALGISTGALLLRLDAQESLRYLCSQHGTNLSRSEWPQFMGDLPWKPTCAGWQ